VAISLLKLVKVVQKELKKQGLLMKTYLAAPQLLAHYSSPMTKRRGFVFSPKLNFD
jgi:hypothetical protein